ncbi:MAG: response regulator [Bacteroidales bacterium]|nr:response regulator [Bacteroidales bacterium]
MKTLRTCLLGLLLTLAFVGARGDARLFTDCNSHINMILQDHAGYIWMATDNGLTRYDGSVAKTFSRTADSPSLLNNIVLSIMEDRDSNLWVGTYDGIQMFDRSTETFTTPRLNYPGVPEFTYVNSIIEDSKGDIWFTTSRSGVISFQGPEREPICFLTTNSAICSDKTSVVFEDKFGNIWIGTVDAGITVYNPSNNTMTHHSHSAADPTTLSGNMIFSITQVNDGRLLIASMDGGIDSYDYRTHRFTRGVVPAPAHAYVLRNDPERNVLYIGTDGSGLQEYDLATGELRAIDPAMSAFDISRSKVHDIVKASDGSLWAAVYQKGVIRIPAAGGSSGIENLGFNPFRPGRSIGAEPVLSIYKDTEGRVWIGTDGDGIYCGTKASADKAREFSNIGIDGAKNGSVLSIFQDSRGTIWAGSYMEGLSRFDSSTGSFRSFRMHDADGKPLDVKQLNTIVEDASGRLWLGTNGSGVCVVDPATGSADLIKHDPGADRSKVICGNSIHTICFDHNGDTWVGTSDAGLSRISAADGRVEHYNLVNRRLPNNCVYSVHEDATGRVWVATAGGLACIMPGGATRFFSDSRYLAGIPIYSILPDTRGNLWLSTIEGVGCFNPADASFNLISPGRLVCREFKRGAAFADASGELWFGGVGGVVRLDSEEAAIQKSTTPDVYLASIGWHNRNKGSDDSCPLFNISDMTLDYGTDNITINFGAVEYALADEMEFAVMLQGLQDSWQSLPAGIRSYTFHDVPPGKYTVLVKASVGGNTPAGVASLALTIEPPIWLTWWAKLIYAVICAGGLVLAVVLFRAKMRRRAREREQAHHESLVEAKLQFFTDISHEIRTPLSLILGPIATLKKSAKDSATRRTYEMMENNGERILRMIAQVIDLRKLDNNRMGLQVAPTDIRVLIARITDSFAVAVKGRDIALSVAVADDVPQSVLLDSDKIDKVVFNVISNAIRFTPDGGSVTVSVDIDGAGCLRIRVADTGPGVPEDERETIFERFYQVKGSSTRGGTGIGLHLCRKMMSAHHGSIFVEESTGAGSVFTVIIPVNPDAYKDSERASEDSVAIREEAPAVHVAEPVRPVRPAGIVQSTKAHTVLVIEDDASIRDYLADSLGADFNIVTADGGEQGLEAALRVRPHCIITDIMMPGIDGLELCRMVRANNEICDIPVVMLTARVADAQRMEGIEAGADSYITKPFSIDHLRTQVSMLIHSRRVIKQKFAGKEPINQEVVSLKSGDEKLMERVEAAVLRELANPDLSVEFIAEHIGVSRSHLHRRLKVLTNMSPSSYIKQARMRHAARLLTEKNLAVSEVAYATGFSSLSHFSTVFKEYYGMSPTRYVAVNSARIPEEKS